MRYLGVSALAAMKASVRILPSLFLSLLMPVGNTGLAQNLASEIGTASRSTDHLTLLPGPGPLSPARGAGVPTPNATPNSGQLRFTPDDKRPSLAEPPTLLRRPGTLVLGNSTTAFPTLTVSGTGSSLPSPDLLRFKAKLESPPASLPLRPPRRMQRD